MLFRSGSSAYTSSKFYNFMFSHLTVDSSLQEIWKSKLIPKLKVFAWLLQRDRLNTKELMARKHWQVEGGPDCVLCTTASLENRDHLFFSCQFARDCWSVIGITWDLTLSISHRFVQAKRLFNGPCFMETVICAMWNIWRSRNDLIFNNRQPSLARWKVLFQADLLIHQHRVKASLVQPLLSWVLDAFT